MWRFEHRMGRVLDLLEELLTKLFFLGLILGLILGLLPGGGGLGGFVGGVLARAGLAAYCVSANAYPSKT
jgi:hypothetical protein